MFLFQTTWQAWSYFNYTRFHLYSQTICDVASFSSRICTSHFKLQEFHNWLSGDKTMFDFSLEAMYSIRLLARSLG